MITSERLVAEDAMGQHVADWLLYLYKEYDEEPNYAVALALLSSDSSDKFSSVAQRPTGGNKISQDNNGIYHVDDYTDTDGNPREGFTFRDKDFTEGWAVVVKSWMFNSSIILPYVENGKLHAREIYPDKKLLEHLNKISQDRRAQLNVLVENIKYNKVNLALPVFDPTLCEAVLGSAGIDIESALRFHEVASITPKVSIIEEQKGHTGRRTVVGFRTSQVSSVGDNIVDFPARNWNILDFAPEVGAARVIDRGKQNLSTLLIPVRDDAYPHGYKVYAINVERGMASKLVSEAKTSWRRLSRQEREEYISKRNEAYIKATYQPLS